jgi:hypothetical protein
MNCGECLSKNVKMVPLVNGVCPECGTDYQVLADVFSLPASKPKPRLKAHAQPIPPPGPMRDVALMQYEWKAWQDVVREFNLDKQIYGDINAPAHNTLIAAIQLWGEKLHKLRANQEERIVEKALRDYEDKYNNIASPE